MDVRSSRLLHLSAAILSLAACSNGTPNGHVESTAPPVVAAPQPAAPKVENDTYLVELKAPAACAPTKECVADVNIVPKGGYHINDTYPYKFKAQDPAPEGVAYSRAVLQRSDGNFEKTKGGFKVAFTPAKAGKLTVKGTLFFSVCSEANCVMDKQELETPVEVK